MTALIVVAAIIAGILLWQDPAPPSHSIYSLDPATDPQLEDVGLVVRVDDFVGLDLRARSGDIWVAGDAALTHVQGVSGEADTPIEYAEDTGSLSDLGFGANGGVWVVHGGSLSRIAPGGTELLEVGLPATPSRVTVGENVWVLASSPDASADPDLVLKLKSSGQVITDFQVSGVDLGLGPGGVWVADEAMSQVVPISSDGVIGRGIAVPHAPDGIAGNDRFVFVFNTQLGTVTGIDTDVETIDPATIDAVPIEHRPIAIRPGDGNLAWTVNQDGTITRFDPTTGDVDTFELPTPATAMTVDNVQGDIWVIAR
jgi:streptogramin lyase